MMQRARWRQIQSIFADVADVAPANRAARLAEQCGDDRELRDSVESLLASDQRSVDPLLDVIGEAAEALLEDHQDRLLGPGGVDPRSWRHEHGIPRRAR